MNTRKLLKKALSGSKNIRFADMVKLIEAFGFELARVTGSHYIFVHGCGFRFWRASRREPDVAF